MKHTLFGTLLLAVPLLTAGAASAAPPSSSTPASHPWSVETELVQPFLPTIGIIHLRAGRTVWGEPGRLRADLLLGAYIRPHIEHDVLYDIDEYMVTLGYRQYFWRGLHAEALLNAGAAWGTNRFDQRYYETATLFGEVNVGYRFGFWEPGGVVGTGSSRVGLYVAPQVGVLTSLGVSDIGPRNGKSDTFPQGALLVGASF